MDENKTVEQDMEEIIQDPVDTTDDNQSVVDDINGDDNKSHETEPTEFTQRSTETGSKRLDKRLEDKPELKDQNLDRILARMRSNSPVRPTDSQSAQFNNSEQQYRPLNYQDGEFTVDQLEQDRRTYANLIARTVSNDAVSTARTERQLERFVDNLDYDLERISDKYPELDPDSSEFNPIRANRLNRMYYDYIGFDPEKGNVPARTDVRYRYFIDGMMGLADELATARNSDSTRNIARQAARTGVRPNATSTHSVHIDSADDISKLSKEEYDKYRDKIMAKTLEMLETS